ncbi:MAG: hypothetical protein JST32_06560, partial [Bacteroidetes bacterium]|nr:hypothetical protein [Bacteroidota bacterium]
MFDELLKYYSGAVRTVLLAQDNITKDWYHIFSVIELFPNDMPQYNIPNNLWYDNKIYRSKIASNTDNYSFYLMIHTFESVKDGCSLFEQPFSYGEIDGQINHYFNTQFIPEPSSSSPLVLPSNIHESDGLSSILPKRNSGVFAWTKIDSARIVEKLFGVDVNSKEMRAISQLTNDWLGFDLSSKPEHLGNMYLTAPNPFYRDLEISLSNNPDGIFYKFNLRKGIKQNFKIRVIDTHGD